MLLRVRSPSGVCKKIDGYEIVSVYFLGDSTGNRTRVAAVKGRCLNRLTMEPHKIAFTI